MITDDRPPCGDLGDDLLGEEGDVPVVERVVLDVALLRASLVLGTIGRPRLDEDPDGHGKVAAVDEVVQHDGRAELVRLTMRATVAAVALMVLSGCVAAAPTSEPASRLESVSKSQPPGTHQPDPNAETCVRGFGIDLVADEAAGHRLYGDINRMQEAMDGGCAPLITPAMHRSFIAQFHEVERRTVRCLVKRGVDAHYHEDRGIKISGLRANNRVVDDCLTHAYAFYSKRPGS